MACDSMSQTYHKTVEVEIQADNMNIGFLIPFGILGESSGVGSFRAAKIYGIRLCILDALKQVNNDARVDTEISLVAGNIRFAEESEVNDGMQQRYFPSNSDDIIEESTSRVFWRALHVSGDVQTEGGSTRSPAILSDNIVFPCPIWVSDCAMAINTTKEQLVGDSIEGKMRVSITVYYQVENVTKRIFQFIKNLYSTFRGFAATK